jgi:cystathionine gamma-synthase
LEKAEAVPGRLKMIKFAESLGDVETLISYPTMHTHEDVSWEIYEKNGSTEYTLRFS